MCYQVDFGSLNNINSSHFWGRVENAVGNTNGPQFAKCHYNRIVVHKQLCEGISCLVMLGLVARMCIHVSPHICDSL